MHRQQMRAPLRGRPACSRVRRKRRMAIGSVELSELAERAIGLFVAGVRRGRDEHQSGARERRRIAAASYRSDASGGLMGLVDDDDIPQFCECPRSTSGCLTKSIDVMTTGSTRPGIDIEGQGAASARATPRR